MNKLKVLWLSSCAPVQNGREAGAKTFYYYYSNMREDDRFDIHVIAFCKNYLKEEAIEDNRGFSIDFIYNDSVSKIKKIANIESRLNPFHRYGGLMTNYGAREVNKRIKALKETGYQPDVIILEWTQMVVLTSDIIRVFSNSKIISSEHDVTFVGYKRKYDYYHGFRKYIWGLKYRNEKKIEINALRKAELIVIQNPDNVKLLEDEKFNSRQLHWLIPFFNNMEQCERRSNGKDVLFYGAMARPENYLSAIWFIENVMPELEALGARFVVLGSNPPDQLRKYEAKNVHITGFVDSVLPYFETAECLVAPLVLGAGIKVKILEAFSTGIPVLTNSIGIEGIPAEDKINYFHCESADDYVKSIKKIFKRADSEEALVNGKKFIQDNYSTEESLTGYKEKLLQIGKCSTEVLKY